MQKYHQSLKVASQNCLSYCQLLPLYFCGASGPVADWSIKSMYLFSKDGSTGMVYLQGAHQEALGGWSHEASAADFRRIDDSRPPCFSTLSCQLRVLVILSFVGCLHSSLPGDSELYHDHCTGWGGPQDDVWMQRGDGDLFWEIELLIKVHS